VAAAHQDWSPGRSCRRPVAAGAGASSRLGASLSGTVGWSDEAAGRRVARHVRISRWRIASPAATAGTIARPSRDPARPARRDDGASTYYLQWSEISHSRSAGSQVGLRQFALGASGDAGAAAAVVRERTAGGSTSTTDTTRTATAAANMWWMRTPGGCSSIRTTLSPSTAATDLPRSAGSSQNGGAPCVRASPVGAGSPSRISVVCLDAARLSRAAMAQRVCGRFRVRFVHGYVAQSLPLPQRAPRPPLELLRSFERVVEVGLDRGFCATEPTRDVSDREVLLVAVVAGELDRPTALLDAVQMHHASDDTAARRCQKEDRPVTGPYDAPLDQGGHICTRWVTVAVGTYASDARSRRTTPPRPRRGRELPRVALDDVDHSLGPADPAATAPSDVGCFQPHLRATSRRTVRLRSQITGPCPLSMPSGKGLAASSFRLSTTRRSVQARMLSSLAPARQRWACCTSVAGRWVVDPQMDARASGSARQWPSTRYDDPAVRK
jgi:hypothetical protein